MANDQLDALVALLRAGADPDERRGDVPTPLSVAAQLGHREVVLTLLASAAHVNAACNKDRTALIEGALAGHGEIVRLKFALLRGRTILALSVLLGVAVASLPWQALKC